MITYDSVIRSSVFLLNLLCLARKLDDVTQLTVYLFCIFFANYFWILAIFLYRVTQLGLVTSPLDIFKLRELDARTEGTGDGRVNLRRVKGWGSRSVNKLLANIDAKRTVSFERLVCHDMSHIDYQSLPVIYVHCVFVHGCVVIVLIRFLFALGIRHIGQQTAVDIASHFRDMNDLWEYLLGETTSKLAWCTFFE